MSYNNNNDYNVIDISGKDSSPTNNTYYCSWCRRKLFYREQDKETGKHVWLCTFCNTEYIPDNQLVKKANRFEVPDGSDPNQDRVPPIAMIDNPNKELSSTSYKQIKLSPSFEALKRQGFKFTSYEER
jgi:CRISPR/Cas system-associated protein Cas10 (large subunit of type III CRISPR-Cas system)